MTLTHVKRRFGGAYVMIAVLATHKIVQHREGIPSLTILPACVHKRECAKSITDSTEHRNESNSVPYPPSLSPVITTGNYFVSS